MFSQTLFLTLSTTLPIFSTLLSLTDPPPRDLENGDLLEVFDTDYQTPSRTLSISAVDPGKRTLVLEDPIPFTGGYALVLQPPPFARVRARVKSSFDAFKTALEDWLGPDGEQDRELDALDRLLNPILVNKNPTAVSLGDFTNELDARQGKLDALGPLVDTFQVSPVSAADSLLATFRQKGSQRAVDLLTSGSFEEFFGMTEDEASYVGAMQARMRDVARNDLPVRKTDRNDVATSRLLSQADTPDPEYVPDDVGGVTENLQAGDG